MKTFLTAAALSLLAVTAAQAASPLAANGVEVRTASVSSAKDINDNGGSTVTFTIGAAKEVPVATLSPRDRAVAIQKSEATTTVSSFGTVASQFGPR